jgi:Domain of unknown function (DUF4863)
MTQPADRLLELLQPVTARLTDLDLTNPAVAKSELDAQLPIDGEVVVAIHEEMLAGVEAGWLVPRESGAVKFGRLAKEQNGFSLDVVLSGGDGPRHRHPNGEINMMFAFDGEPIFDGHPPGWAVFAPDSVHVPGVTGGKMLILYLLPDGAVEWV